MTEEDWLGESIHVFKGDITNEADKLALVLPILGLYAELYAVCVVDSAHEVPFAHNLLSIIQSSRDEILPRTFRPAASLRRYGGGVRRLSSRQSCNANVTVSRPFEAGNFLSSPTLRPREKRFDAALSESSPGASPSPGKKETEEKSANTELFGILVETVEELINKNKELREGLHLSYVQRRGKKTKRRDNLTKAQTRWRSAFNFKSISPTQSGASVFSGGCPEGRLAWRAVREHQQQRSAAGRE